MAGDEKRQELVAHPMAIALEGEELGQDTARRPAAVHLGGGALLATITEAVEAQPDAERQLRASIAAFFALVASDPFAWRTLFRDPPTDPEIATLQRAAQEETTGLIASMFIAGGAPAARRGDVTLVAEMFKSALNGLAAWWWEHPELDREHLVELAHATLWHGIGSLPRDAPAADG